MTERELKKLSRIDLLELLVEQSNEVEKLRRQLEESERKLKDRTITIERAGSLAEAAMLINGVIEAAQAACSQYEENIRTLSDQETERCRLREQASKDQAEALMAEAREESRRMLEECRRQCRQLRRETEESCAQLRRKAEEESKAYWDDVSRQVSQLLAESRKNRQN